MKKIILLIIILITSSCDDSSKTIIVDGAGKIENKNGSAQTALLHGMII